MRSEGLAHGQGLEPLTDLDRELWMPGDVFFEGRLFAPPLGRLFTLSAPATNDVVPA